MPDIYAVGGWAGVRASRGKSKMEAAGRESRAKTMVAAIERLDVVRSVVESHEKTREEDAGTGVVRGDAGGTVETKGEEEVTMRVLCLGADRREGTTPAETSELFEEVRTQAKEGGVDVVEVTCVGPNVKVEDAYDLGVVYDSAETRGMEESESMAALRVEYRTGLYHEEVVGENPTPDVAFAFNAGIWGYDPSDWHPTIERVVVQEQTPLVVTSYSLLEAESDEDAMRSSLEHVENVSWEWEAEENPSSSRAVRTLGFDRREYLQEKDREDLFENSAWQCVALAAV